MAEAMFVELPPISEDTYDRPSHFETTYTRVSTTDVIELLLKNPTKLDTLLRDERHQRELVPRLMAVALAGFLIYGVVVTGILNAVRVRTGVWLDHVPAARWNDFSAGNLAISYAFGLTAANGICLPSFYFYGLLAGIRTTALGVTAHALKGMAAGAIALVGLLPVYFAFALTALVFPWLAGWPVWWVVVGLALPFIAGTWGAVNLYRGFVALADTMPHNRRCKRECFLRRLMLAWIGCYTFVTPVVIFSLWDLFDHWTTNL